MGRDLYLAELLRRPLLGKGGETVGRLSDVIVRLRGRNYPLVTGLVARLGGREVFLPGEQVASWGAEGITLTSRRVNLGGFERREGEVLLRADVLGHRVIDVPAAEFVRAYDLVLERTSEGLVVTGLNTHRPRRLARLFGGGDGEHDRRDWRDWKSFEPLIGHARSARVRSVFGRLGRLKPADIADLLEEASRTESHEILQTVHSDPELEADVFEELEPDSQIRLLRERSDAEIAKVIARMRADDATDAVNELPQARRQPVLDALPARQRVKVLTLMGFNPSSAGGLMALDVLTAAPGITAAEALREAGGSRALQPEVLTTVYLIGEGDRLTGAVTLVDLLQADPAARLEQLADADPVRVVPDTDIEDVALLMTDYNLLTVPVVDDEERILGVITVDDVLEVIIPSDWRRRGHAPRPPGRPERESPASP